MKRNENDIRTGKLKKNKWVRGFKSEGLKGDLMQRYFPLDEWEKF